MTATSPPRKICKRGNSDQVSITDEMLERAGLERGDRVAWIFEDDELKLEQVRITRVSNE